MAVRMNITAGASAPKPPSEPLPTATTVPAAVGAAEVVAMYGVTKSRKTTQLVELAKRIWRLHRKKTLVVLFEPASGMPVLKSAVQAGLIEVLVFDSTIKNRQGFTAMNPLSMATQFLNGLLHWDPAYKALVTRSDWPTIGCVAFDTMDTWAGLIMDMLSEKGAAEDKSAKDDSGKPVKASGLASPGWEDEFGIVHGFGQPSHYGKTGSELVSFMQRFPSTVFTQSGGSVQMVIYTFHESNKEKEDGDTRTNRKKADAVKGPELIGREAVKKVGAATGMLLHLVPIGGPNPTVWVYFENHESLGDPVPFPACARTSAEGTKKLKERWKSGHFDLAETSIAEFIDTVDALAESETAALTAWMADATPAPAEPETPTTTSGEQS